MMNADDRATGAAGGEAGDGPAQPRPPQSEALLAAFMADPACADALLQACRESPELAEELAGHLEVERLLREHAASEDAERFAEEVAARLRREGDEAFVGAVAQRIRRERAWGAARRAVWAAAALALFAAGAWLLRTPQPAPRAVLARQASAVWAGAQLAVGEPAPRGELTLLEGLAELSLPRGVRLILEAPLTLDLSEPRRVVLKSGSLVAAVPPQATGFTVVTPSSEVVDLGTEFGVSVDPRGASEVCVLKGEVKARGSRAQAFVRMVQDEACAFDPGRQMTMLRGDPSRYLRALPGRSSASPEYLHWSFDGAGNPAACGGTGINGRRYDGALKALRAGEGPLVQPGVFGNALYFNGRDAYVETGFPGIGGTAPRTVAFWTRVPQGDIEHSGYAMLCWGLMEPGAAWQISANPFAPEGPLGRIRAGTMKGMVIGSTDLRDNRWHHVAIVMYGGDKADTSTHVLVYVDGKLEKTSRKSVAGISTDLDDARSQPLRFGRNLGFRDDAGPARDRFFNGWLDEIFVFDAALDQGQIESLMKKNRL